jgi:glycosyltransferase involved in cell wall biosynthesis
MLDHNIMKIGIDATRNRSGGAKAHIIGLLNELNVLSSDIHQIHIWSYQDLLNLLPDDSRLVKHSPKVLNWPIFIQLFWQFFILPKEAKKVGISILLNTSAGSICPFYPSVTMSRDMLSYEKGEIDRYPWGRARIRLILLKIIQNHSLRNSKGAIFLTNYASDVIQKYSGKIKRFRIIPHGISSNFRTKRNLMNWEYSSGFQVRCIYVSNVDFYKHQWNVVQAISKLRKRNINISIKLIGGGFGNPQKRLEREISIADPLNEFVTQLKFLPHKEIPMHLEESDLFIFASSCENMPNTLVEGMSMGLPIVCSNRGPMPEVLKDGGIFFDPENVDSIAEAIERMIFDKELRIQLTTRSLNYSKEFSWERCAKETFDFLIHIYKSI